MNPLLHGAIGSVRAWTRLYTMQMDPAHRDERRAEIESDLWEFHEDARRRGHSPEVIALHMLARLLFGVPHDVLWRIEYEGDEAMTPRRSTWMTAAAVGAAVSVGALWVFFAVTSLVALPPLPDSVDVARIYLQPMRPPPPPPPPAPRGLRVLDVHLGLMPPPPPPPPPPQ
jgi:hypothetical protein